MPIYSSDVAAQIGAYQQQYTNNAAYSGMLTNMMASQGPAPVQAEQISGGLISRAGAIGAPMLGLGLGMMGLDPFSAAVRLGGAGFAKAGMGGAIAGGVAGFAGVGGLMAAGGYAAHQVWSGMEQQQHFNQSMRQSFNFLSPQGRGFTTGQLGMMGNELRGMAGQVGSMGEMTSFHELSGLAANMGKMGMANGVRDVQEFSRKFREMVSTLKTVSQELGTSLTSAQEFTASMKGSGIFRASDQIKAATQMRGFTASGTLAVSELTSMGNIGSQISRAVGGRGRSGFFAGMRTMGMVGAAMDAGTLSEEDIYNATGLTGAEGRQAYATSQLSNAASFLRTGKGRYFLASVAGKDGQLDSNSVQQWMAGDVGVGRTKGMAGSNLGKVGRANFIRNEGRLRGAAMEQFGGMMPAMALMNWAEERGVDIAGMGDREMLFASRHLGIGMDQMEATVKQVRDLPKALESMRQTKEMDRFSKAEAGRKATQGIEGAKKKIEQHREHLQNALQQVGATLYTDFTNMVESSINKMTGTYVEQATAGLPKAVSAARRGDSMAASRLMGLSSAGKQSMAFRGGTSSMDTWGQRADQFTNRGFMGLGTSDLDRMSGAGFGSLFGGAEGPGTVMRDAAVSKGLSEYRGFKQGLTRSGDSAVMDLASKHKDLIAEMYAGKVGGMQGMDRAHGVIGALLASGKLSESERDLLAKQLGGNAEAKGSFLAAIEGDKGANIAAEARTAMEKDVSLFAGGGGRFRTLDDRNRAVGDAVLGGQRKGAIMNTLSGLGLDRLFKVPGLDKGAELLANELPGSVEGGSRMGGALAGALGGSMAGPIGMLLGATAGYLGGGVAGRQVDKALTGSNSDTSRYLGEYLHSEKGMAAATTMMYGSDKEKAAMMADMRREEQGLSARIGRGEKGLDDQYKSMRAMRGTYELTQDAAKGMSREDLDKKARSFGFGSAADAMKGAQAIGGAVEAQQEVNRKQVGLVVGSESREKMDQFKAAGLVDEKGNIADINKLKISGKGKEALMGMIADAQKGSDLDRVAGTSEERDRLNSLLGEGGSMAANRQKLMSMSVAEQREMASKMREMGLSGVADELSASAGYRSRAERTLQLRGGNVGMAALLGINVSQGKEGIDKARRLAGLKDPKALAAALSGELGLSGASVESAERDLAAAKENLGEAGSAGYAERKAALDKMQSRLEDAKASDPIKQKLASIAAMKDPSKKAAALQELSPDLDKFKMQQQERKKAEEGKRDPVVQAIGKLEEKIGEVTKAVTQSASSIVSGIGEKLPGGGKGGDNKPLKRKTDALLHNRF